MFYESAGIANESSGWFTFNLSSVGAYSGQLKLGRTYTLRGQFDVDGVAESTITRLVGAPLTVNLSVNTLAGSDLVSGTVSDGVWTAVLGGDRLVYHATTNPAPQLGLYTMLIPGSNDPAQAPGGSGYATVRVDGAGRVRMSGVLADGKAISQTTFLSKNGQWPMYVPLYVTNGSVISWLTFTNQFNSSLAGNLSWIKTGAAGGSFYPLGFTNEVFASGSSFTIPATGQRSLQITNGLVLLSGGNLTSSLVNNVLYKTNNTVTTVSGTATNLTLKVATNGVVTGTFKRPNGTTASIKGVVLQQQNTAGGFFLGTNQSGAFLLQQN